MKHLSEKKIFLYAADMLNDKKKRRVADHLTSCDSCQQILDENTLFIRSITAPPLSMPDMELLKSQRNQLISRIRTLNERPRAKQYRPRIVFPYRNLLSTAIGIFILCIGIYTGGQIEKRNQRDKLAFMLGQQQFTSLDIRQNEHKYAQISLTYKDRDEKTLTARLEDQVIQCALAVNLLTESQDNIRLKNIDLIRPNIHNRPVIDALINLANKDTNPGIRFKALELLGPFISDRQVTECFITTYLDDDTNGLRIKALRYLSRSFNTQTRSLLSSWAVSDPVVKALLIDQVPQLAPSINNAATTS
ncbi:HEAT repeat domain-containing protein [bacterium]|nr:HEAT repeat domain-containing protein [bacterium]